MEELLRVRRDLEGLLAALAEIELRFHRGWDADRRAPYRRFGAAVHAEAPEAIAKARAAAGSEAAVRGLDRLAAAVLAERVRAAALEDDEALAAWELAATVRGPEGEMPLRAARRRLRAEPEAGRRARLAEAIARTEAEARGRRADRLERMRERLAALGGARDDGLAAEAEEALRASEDAHRELLPWALRRARIEGAPGEGDLAFLLGGIAAGGLFPAGALRLGVGGLVERMGFDAGRRGLRLDLDRRPGARTGACVAPLEPPSRVAISLSPEGIPADFRALLGAVARGLGWAVLPRRAPVEEGRLGDRVAAEAAAAVFAQLLAEPLFLRRALGAGRGEAADVARFFAACELLRLRLACAAHLAERELWRRGASRPALEEAEAWLARAAGVRLPVDPVLGGAAPGPGRSERLRGARLAAPLARALVERFDEDWFRNPRAGPYLEGLFARGAAAGEEEVRAAIGAEAPTLAARALALAR